MNIKSVNEHHWMNAQTHENEQTIWINKTLEWIQYAYMNKDEGTQTSAWINKKNHQNTMNTQQIWMNTTYE